MQLPFAIRTLESLGWQPTVLHLGPDRAPVSGLLFIDGEQLVIDDGAIRDSDLQELMEELTSEPASDA